MPFTKVDTRKEIEERINKDECFKKAYIEADKEYELIKGAVKMRKELGISQDDIAEKSGLTQQVISRMECVGSSPTLKNFLRYLDGIGLTMTLSKKR